MINDGGDEGSQGSPVSGSPESALPEPSIAEFVAPEDYDYQAELALALQMSKESAGGLEVMDAEDEIEKEPAPIDTTFGCPPELFVTPIPEALQCMLCKNVPSELRRCAECCRVMCAGCANAFFVEIANCPCCARQQKVNQMFQGGGIPYDILKESQVIRCPHFPVGCGFEGKFKEVLEEHLFVCPEMTTACPHTDQGCNVSLRRKELDIHTGECQFQPICCPHCQEPRAYLQAMRHQGNCPEEPIGCRTEGCERILPRWEMEMHSQFCDRRRVECGLCGESVQGSDLPGHLDKGHARTSIEEEEALRSMVETQEEVYASLSEDCLFCEVHICLPSDLQREITKGSNSPNDVFNFESVHEKILFPAQGPIALLLEIIYVRLQALPSNVKLWLFNHSPEKCALGCQTALSCNDTTTTLHEHLYHFWNLPQAGVVPVYLMPELCPEPPADRKGTMVYCKGYAPGGGCTAFGPKTVFESGLGVEADVRETIGRCIPGEEAGEVRFWEDTGSPEPGPPLKEVTVGSILAFGGP